MGVSYWILSDEGVYIDRPYLPRVKPKVKPEDIKSMQSKVKPSPTSYGYGKHFNYTIIGDKVHLRFANRGVETYTSYDFKKWGPSVVQAWDEDDSSMQRWVNAANKNPPARKSNNLMPSSPEFGLFKGITQIGLYMPNVNDTPPPIEVTPEIAHIIPINKTGLYYSKIHNLRQTLLNMLNDPEKKLDGWVDLLGKHDINPKEFPFHALGVQKDIEGLGYYAAFYPGKKILITEFNFHDNVSANMRRYGISGDDAVKLSMGADLEHELAHAYGIGGSNISERLQGFLRAKRYQTLAEIYKGTSRERIYRAIANEGMDYADEHSFLRGLLGEFLGDSQYKPSIESILAKTFAEEADAYELEGATREHYISKRIEERLGALRGAPSYKGTKKDVSIKNRRTDEGDDSLEQAIERAIGDDGSSETNQDSDRASTYNGKRINGEGARMPAKLIGKKLKISDYKSMDDAESNLNAGAKDNYSPPEEKTAEIGASSK